MTDTPNTQTQESQAETPMLDLDDDTPLEQLKKPGPSCTDEICEACQ